jgi:glutathione S-transferase
MDQLVCRVQLRGNSNIPPALRSHLHQLRRFSEEEARDWICSAANPTIADIVCFLYIMLSESGIPRQDYPAIRRRCDRVKQIKGFVVMSVFPAGPPRAA